MKVRRVISFVQCSCCNNKAEFVVTSWNNWYLCSLCATELKEKIGRFIY